MHHPLPFMAAAEGVVAPAWAQGNKTFYFRNLRVSIEGKMKGEVSLYC
jgi:hypothetical protein